MRSLLSVLQSFGSVGALRNARAELELTHSRNVQAAVLVRRVGTIDASAARRTDPLDRHRRRLTPTGTRGRPAGWPASGSMFRARR